MTNFKMVPDALTEARFVAFSKYRVYKLQQVCDSNTPGQNEPVVFCHFVLKDREILVQTGPGKIPFLVQRDPVKRARIQNGPCQKD